MRYLAYRMARATLPKRIADHIGRSGIVTGPVEWEGLRFTFSAPPRIFHQARTRGIENRICRLLRSVLRPGDVAVDVGMNYGFISHVMAHSVGPVGSVVSFEMNPNIAEVARATVAQNQLSGVVSIDARAVGAEATGGMVTVDQAVIGEVRFLKIDTDGADLSVLEGARQTLASHAVVVVELCANHRAIYDLLRDAGYSHLIGMDNEPVVPPAWPLNLIASVSPVAIPPRR